MMMMTGTASGSAKAGVGKKGKAIKDDEEQTRMVL